LARLLEKLPDGTADDRDSGPEQNDDRYPEGDFNRSGQTIVKTRELSPPALRHRGVSGIFGMEQEAQKEEENGCVGFLHDLCLGCCSVIARTYLIR
jgi:hypothetical protein